MQTWNALVIVAPAATQPDANHRPRAAEAMGTGHVERSAGGNFCINLRDEIDEACSVEHAAVVDRTHQPPTLAVDLPPQFKPLGSIARLGRLPTGQIDGRDDTGVGQTRKSPADTFRTCVEKSSG